MNLTKLDKAFSEYTRRKNADDNGHVKCCTCPTVKHWKEMDAGHFVSRRHLATRWRESNCHAQCQECNRHDSGALVEYLMFMKDKYGYEEAWIIVSESKAAWKPMQFEIDELTEYYKNKIKELDNGIK